MPGTQDPQTSPLLRYHNSTHVQPAGLNPSDAIYVKKYHTIKYYDGGIEIFAALKYSYRFALTCRKRKAGNLKSRMKQSRSAYLIASSNQPTSSPRGVECPRRGMISPISPQKKTTGVSVSIILLSFIL